MTKITIPEKSWVKCDDQQFPTEAGWYAVRLPGEVQDEFTFYSLPDYTEFAEWVPTEDDLPIDHEEGNPCGGWNMLCDEPNGMLGWFGPIEIPEYPS